MAFSQATQQIVLRFRHRQAARTDAYLGLMYDVEAIIKGQMLPELPPVVPSSHRVQPVEQSDTISARKARASKKLIEGQPLTPDEEDALLFSDVENL